MLTRPELPARWRMSAIAPAKRPIFMESACTPSHSAVSMPWPLPAQIWLREGSCHDLQSVREQAISLPDSALIGDRAFPDPTLQQMLAEQRTTLLVVRKK